MQNLKLFVQARQKRTDEIGRLCHKILSDGSINWTGNQYDQMRRISQLGRKFDQSVMDQFFHEFKSQSK